MRLIDADNITYGDDPDGKIFDEIEFCPADGIKALMELQPTVQAVPIELWNELKETITEMRDNDGTGTQQEVCKFLTNLMDVLEKQIEWSDAE